MHSPLPSLSGYDPVHETCTGLVWPRWLSQAAGVFYFLLAKSTRAAQAAALFASARLERVRPRRLRAPTKRRGFWWRNTGQLQRLTVVRGGSDRPAGSSLGGSSTSQLALRPMPGPSAPCGEVSAWGPSLEPVFEGALRLFHSRLGRRREQLHRPPPSQRCR
jgi:hypothetical protein